MKKVITGMLLILVIVLGGSTLFLFVGKIQPASAIVWGVGFSQRHAEALGLDWRAVYTALLDDLEVRHIKVSFDWKELEPEKDQFSFQNADWQVAEAEKRNAELLVVMGMKTLRWPECHLPEWVKELSKEEQQQEVLELVEVIVARYKDSPAVVRWQVENEPLFSFGDCPWIDKEFFEKEVRLVRSLDPNRPVVVADTGEFSFWVRAAQTGDVVSPTMYRKVWFQEINRYVVYPFPPTFYGRKAQFIEAIFDKEIIGGELQAEPWGPGKLLYDTTLQEQNAAFDLAQLKENISFAEQTGIAEHYLWGAEWWYWRMTVSQDSTFWEEAKMLFED
jgi:hypothetical protein